MVGSAISPAPDFLNDDWCVSGGSAVGPIEVNSPALHVRTDATGCQVVVHSRDRVSVPPEIRQNGHHVAARSTRPGAHRCLRIGADDQIEGYQSRPKTLGRATVVIVRSSLRSARPVGVLDRPHLPTIHV